MDDQCGGDSGVDRQVRGAIGKFMNGSYQVGTGTGARRGGLAALRTGSVRGPGTAPAGDPAAVNRLGKEAERLRDFPARLNEILNSRDEPSKRTRWRELDREIARFRERFSASEGVCAFIDFLVEKAFEAGLVPEAAGVVVMENSCAEPLRLDSSPRLGRDVVVLDLVSPEALHG
jgi:hypothetical protein